MKVYKLKAFARFQRRERIDDVALSRAVTVAEAGLIDADLGGGLIKQRISRPRQGKSGAYRTVIAYRRGARAVYLFGFAKSDRENLDADEVAYWRRIGSGYLELDEALSETAIADDALTEVNYDDKD